MNAAALRVGANPLRGRSIVLVAGDLSTGGGANRIVRDLSTIFSERLGLQTTVVSVVTAEPTYPFLASVKIEYYPWATSPRAFWKLIRRIGRSRPDYVVGFWHYDNIRLALNAALSGQRSILTEHTSWHHPPLRTRVMRALTYRFAKAVCVLNPVEFKHYRRFLSNVALLPNPVPALSAPDDVAKEKLILAVGHLIDRKNFSDAVLAMAASGLANEGWRLAIVGSGSEQKVLEELIREHSLQDAATIEPPTGEIAKWYARASVMLVTSTIEVFSLVLAEAMSLQVVPLAYAADGPTYLLESRPDLLVERGDVRALGEQLGLLCRTSDLDAIGHEMKQTVEDRFSEEAIAARWQILLAD